MIIGLAGDWHGMLMDAYYALESFAKEGVHHVEQVGDFGVGSGREGKFYVEKLEARCVKHDIDLYVTPGNHEDWARLETLWSNPKREGQVLDLSPHIHVRPRGQRFELGGRSFVSLGGAPSIDFEMRREGISWWREEMIPLEVAEKVAADGHADVMLAHDSPDGGTDRVQSIINTPTHLSGWSEAGLRYAREGRIIMNIAYEGVLPKVFAHGHFHVWDDAVRSDGRVFLSLHMGGLAGNVCLLDLDTLAWSWDAKTWREAPGDHHA